MVNIILIHTYTLCNVHLLNKERQKLKCRLPAAGSLLLNFFNLHTKKPSKFSTCG